MCSPLMLVEIIFARERLLALLAGEHLLARVGDEMARQMLLPTEGLIAALFGAFKGTQPLVKFDVLRKMLLLLELALAVGTGKCIDRRGCGRLSHRTVGQLLLLLLRLRLGLCGLCRCRYRQNLLLRSSGFCFWILLGRLTIDFSLVKNICDWRRRQLLHRQSWWWRRWLCFG